MLLTYSFIIILPKYEIITVHESGFQKGPSTSTTLKHPTHNIINCMDKVTAGIMVHSKAFDSLNHLLTAQCCDYGFDSSTMLP